MIRRIYLKKRFLAILLLVSYLLNLINPLICKATESTTKNTWKLFKYEVSDFNAGHIVDVTKDIKSEVSEDGKSFTAYDPPGQGYFYVQATLADKGKSKDIQSSDLYISKNENKSSRIISKLEDSKVKTSIDYQSIKDENPNLTIKNKNLSATKNIKKLKPTIISHIRNQTLSSSVSKIPFPQGAMISEDKKTFTSGNLYEPGVYFAAVTVKDKTGQEDTAYTESVTVANPGQMVGVFATTDPSDNKIFNKPFETSGLEDNGTIPVKFKSTVFGNYKSISYLWDFGDGTCQSSANPQTAYPECFVANPTHNYFDGNKSFGGAKFDSRKSITPKVKIKAMFGDGSSEEWDASTGTITFNAEPNFILLDLKPDQTSGIVPFTVNLMIDPLTAKIVNATPIKYELDWGDGSEKEISLISAPFSLDNLTSKTFTHTYSVADTYAPKLTIYVQESTKTFNFYVLEIVAGARGEAGVYILDDLSSTQFTNNPIVTFMVNTVFANPYDPKNSLKIKVKDGENAETVTELNPNSKDQTISISEGKNTYYFESVDSSSQSLMTNSGEVSLDTTLPVVSDLKASLSNDLIKVSGVIIEENLQKVELKIDNGVPTILSSDEAHLIAGETNEFKIEKTVNSLSNGEHSFTVNAYDLAGNISEEIYLFRKENGLISQFRIIQEGGISYISNFKDKLEDAEVFEVNETVIAGNPYVMRLYSCFSDDQSLKKSGVEANLNISSIKLKEIKQNGLVIPKTDTELDSIFNNLLLEKNTGCIDLGALDGLSMLNCTDSAKTACYNSCVHFDNAVCGFALINSKHLNNPGVENRFSFTSQESDPTKPWDVGTYEFKFQVNEDSSSCIEYGTCLGKDPNSRLVSQNYKYTVNVKREPTAKLKVSKNTATKGSITKVLSIPSLIYKGQNNLELELSVIDNVPFNPSANKVPVLNLSSRKWTGLGNSSVNPEVTIQSAQVDNVDPGIYIFKLQANVNPTTTDKITLSIPIKLPEDVFNPNGIEKIAYIELPVITNISAEILTPEEGTVVSDKASVTSKVSRPPELEQELGNLLSCKKSEIFYGVKFANEEKWYTVQKSTPQNTDEKVASKGIIQSDGSIKYANVLNFNLKNNSIFTKGFISGELFGLIEVGGQYSTSCTPVPVFYTGNSKKYILLDNPKLVKTKCSRIKNSDKSQCEITVSNNTTVDDLELEVIPDVGNVDSTTCHWDKITFENSKKLSKDVKIPCLPGNANKFTIKLKRSPEFINKVKSRLSGTTLSLIPLDSKLVADTKDSFVSGEIEEEDEDPSAVFKIGDPDGKTAAYNGQSISVLQLKDLLFELGLITSIQRNQSGYSEDVNKAFWDFVCIINSSREGINDPSLRFQTADNPLMCTVTYTESPNISYVQDVSIWVEVVKGLKAKLGNELSNYLNPATIGTLAVFIAWNSILPINAWIIFIGGFVGSGIDIASRVFEVKDLWNNPLNTNASQTTGWKIGYTTATFFAALPALPANVIANAKTAKIVDKLDDFNEIEALIVNRQKSINNTSNYNSLVQQQLELVGFEDYVDGLSLGAKSGFNEALRLGNDTEKNNVYNLVSKASNDELTKLKGVILERTDIIDTPEIVNNWKGNATKDAANAVSDGVTRTNALNDKYSRFVEVGMGEIPTEAQLQSEGIFRGPLANDYPPEGYTVILQSDLVQFMTIGSVRGIRFFTDLESLGNLNSITIGGLIQKLNLSNDYNSGAVLIKFSTDGKVIRKPAIKDSGFNSEFRNGGTTRSGANEWITPAFINIEGSTFDIVKRF